MGGKKAKRAAMVDVTPPMPAVRLSLSRRVKRGGQLQRRRLVALGGMRRDARRVWIGGFGGGASAERRDRERERGRWELTSASFFPCPVLFLFNLGVALLLVCGSAGLDRSPVYREERSGWPHPDRNVSDRLRPVAAMAAMLRCGCCCLAGPAVLDWWRQYVPCY